MAPASSPAYAAALFSAAAALFVAAACGSDTAADPAGGGSAGAALGGSSSGSSNGGSTHQTEAGAVGTHGGTDSGNAGETSGTSGGSGGNTGPSGGSSPGASGAAGAAASEPPGPAPGGGSVYAVKCTGETAMCGVEGTHCLGITLNTGDVGYSCSNHCDSVADCSDAPSGAEAEAGCVQFTKEKRCVLVCYSQPNMYACPDGMSCYIYPNAPIGYCLWKQ
jgi:hypothetical protein